ncbi:MAG: hypothetical protein J6J36_04175 [Clostridia bacterium]|nr:hypothetical protein [Clostridia bacterium]
MEELDLKKLISIFWNKRLHIIVISIIAIIIGAIYSFYFVTPKYQSYTTLVLVKATEDSETATKTITSSDVGLAKSLIGTYSQFAKSKSILRPTINNLQLDESEESLIKKITVSEIDDTEMLKIIVKDEDPVKAMKIANELTRVFAEKISQVYVDNVYILDEAEESITPCNVNHAKDILIFFVIGLVLSAVYVLISNMFDTTVKDSDDVENSAELTALVSIPFVSDDGKKGGMY